MSSRMNNPNNQHHESIRNLIASNFKQPSQSPKSEARSDESNQSTSVATPTGPHSPSNPNRRKSHSISNAELSRQNSNSKKVSFSNLQSANSSPVTNQSSSSSSSGSIDNSENENSDDEGQKREAPRSKYNIGDVVLRRPDFKGSGSKSKVSRGADYFQPQNHATLMPSVTPSPSSVSPSVSTTSLNKRIGARNRYSYGGEKLALTKSLDSQLLEPSESNNSTNSFLPEFNNRPLTDTPFVSYVGSPITREQSNGEDYDNQAENGIDSIHKSKNISHLNLTDLADNQSSSETESLRQARNSAAHVAASMVGTQSTSVKSDIRRPSYQPTDPEAEIKVPHSHLAVEGKGARPKQAASIPEDTKKEEEEEQGHEQGKEQGQKQNQTQTLEQRQKQTHTQTKLDDREKRLLEIEMEQEKQKQADKKAEINLTKDFSHLLKDVPPHMKEQFEKTPSIEQLKNLLLTTKPPITSRKTYTLNIPGQTKSKTSPDGKIASVDVGSKLVIVMVGLPARGKSYITNKLTRYLNWLQHDCRVFNVGNTRRKSKLNAGPEQNPLPDSHPNSEVQSPVQGAVGSSSGVGEMNKQSAASKAKTREHDASFFNPDNKASTALREKWAMDTLDMLLDYVISGPGSVGIFDATNSTKSRRKKVLKKIQERSNGELKVLFLESICSDPAIIESNIRLKLSGPDYKNMDPEVALKDFVGRLHNYEKAYESIDDEEEQIPGFQYVKMIDVGKKVVSFNIQGFLSSQTVYFLLNFNLCERQIWLTRHGESRDNVSGRIGGDSHLTRRGKKFAKALATFMNFQREEFRKQQLERFSTRLELKYNSMFNADDVAAIPNEPNFCVWTSMMHRAVESGVYFNEQVYSVKQMRMLNEIGAGKCEGMTYEEIQEKYPREFESRLENKLSYRYPGVGGESYLDVLTRLRPLITEIERTTDHLLIISHRVVLRILIGYFLNLQPSDIVQLDVPLHSLYKLETNPYGTKYALYTYREDMDWFVETKPENQKNVQEMGLAFNEKRFSIVPTVPKKSI
ncbi:PFK26 [Candida margitis]|uniref:PFK26 n=1 Tax=Candida margitis TaxID=1775924 RepID=UPI002226AA09|nr:PFK26 [Candida margitis]KAI5969277.1 PFK26 [Candida margitis]